MNSAKDSMLQEISCQGVFAAKGSMIFAILHYAADTSAYFTPDIFQTTPFRIGVSNLFRDMADCQYFKEQALEALKYSRMQIAEFRKIALQSIIFHQDSTYRRLACHPLALLLAAYDKKNQADLFRTLYLYLANERSLCKTAAQLFIHRNTVLYRLEKIQLLYPIDLDDAEERTYLLFSMMIYSTLDAEVK